MRNLGGIFPKGGCLIFFGDIFGGRFHENYHQITAHDYDEIAKIICIHFSEGEICTIYEPENILYGNEAFIIQDASRITWDWYYYGRDKNVENLCRWDFKKVDSLLVSKTENGNLSSVNGKTLFNREGQPALQFV